MRKKIMGALLLVTVLAAMEGTIVSTAIPRITSDLSGIELVSWVYAVYMLATAVSAPIYGKLADLFGRKKIMVFGIILFLIGAALCGIAFTMEQLIIFRAIQGLGAGVVMPVTMTIIGDLYTETKDRAKAQGWISAVWGVAGVLGPLLGGFIVDTMSWRYIFFLNLPFGLVALVMLLKFYREDASKEKQSIDYLGAAAFSIGTISLLYALLSGSQSQDWSNPVIISLFAAALAVYGAFVWIEKRAAEPIIPLNLFSNKRVLIVNMLTLLTGAVIISITIYLPIWSQGVLGKSATAAGFILMPMPVCWTFGSIIAGNLVGRLKAQAIITMGTAILSAGAFLLFSLSAQSPEFFIYASIGMMGLGMGLITPIFMLIIQGSVPSNKRGSAVALNTFISTFSQTLGSAVFGTIFNLVTLSQAGKGNLNLNASFDHGNVPAEQLEGLQGILASGVHFIYGGTLILALLSFGMSWLLVKVKDNAVQETL
ncbi:DHA2 family efflux MFS transporter permease subunit [Bacillus sp. FJAT-42376]|uniref:MDR family MFS transporter n=1 Tax=Bacillus sp. FJAT-42376 TaxID=2014076 RepID=UPI000F4DE0EF|nr:MDR family MFS transporter [Bacillus sp. FJAT-42376]AZB42102.1 DHA2 family efflux MFS transporter permease subunit [Bacillus sp. FJAT-42376]